MVGFDHDRSVPVSNTFLAGLFGGIVTRGLVSPLDVMKIRFQLQPESNRAHLKYSGIGQAFAVILREEGWKAFWKGHCPAQCLSMINGGLQFSSFQIFTSLAHKIYPHTREHNIILAASHFTCGCLSGALANCISQPVDVLRTRLAAQKEPMIYRSVSALAWRMLKYEGVTSFYKGLTPSLIQVVPYCGFQFASYTMLEKFWRFLYHREGWFSHLSCGAVAGISSKIVVYPLDVTKKRLQVQGFNEATVSTVVNYKGFRHCVVTIVKTEGLAGLYKGLSVAVIKSGAMTGLIFCTYEFFSELLRSGEQGAVTCSTTNQ